MTFSQQGELPSILKYRSIVFCLFCANELLSTFLARLSLVRIEGQHLLDSCDDGTELVDPVIPESRESDGLSWGQVEEELATLGTGKSVAIDVHVAMAFVLVVLGGGSCVCFSLCQSRDSWSEG